MAVAAVAGPSLASASTWKKSQAPSASPAPTRGTPTPTTPAVPHPSTASAGVIHRATTPAPPAVPSGVDPDAGVPGVAPPATVAADCSADVSGPLQRWLAGLAPGTLVRPVAHACYRIDRGITLTLPQGLTIDGGTYKNTTTETSFTGHRPGRPTFNIIGGTGATFEDLTITGANHGGYHRSMAFEGGIELQGTVGATIDDVAINHVYGDGISLEPLRGGTDHRSGAIISATKNLTVHTVDITNSGRQGISLVSVDGATIENVALRNVGLSTFDVEADEAKEGARNVTIDGCTSSTWNGGAFFANEGASAGSATSNIVVENCRMLHPQGGNAVIVTNASKATTPRGPITFTDDTLWCGASSAVGCFELNHANVSVSQSVIRFPKRNQSHADLYHAGGGTTLALLDDSVRNWTHLGQHRASSTVAVSGGTWQPMYSAVKAHPAITVSHAGTARHVAAAAAQQKHRARHARKQKTKH
jgi:hypothetical protein